jgi:hypothetical protein
MTQTIPSSKAHSNGGFLILLIPVAAILTVLFIAWRILTALLIGSLGWRLWQTYQWQQLRLQIYPFFHNLILENQGAVTVIDLSLKANIPQDTAKRYLNYKAAQFGAQIQELADQGEVYYFLTSRTLGSILDANEPTAFLEPSQSVESVDNPITEVPTENISEPSSVTEVRLESVTKVITEIAEVSSVTEVVTEVIETPTITETVTEVIETPTITETATEVIETPTITEIVAEVVETPTITEIVAEVVETPTITETETITVSKLADAFDDSEPAEFSEPPTEVTVSKLGDIFDQSEPSDLQETNQTVETKTPTPSAIATINITKEESKTEELAAKSKTEKIILNQTQLAKRFKLSPSTIGYHKNKAYFPDWSKERDPEGIAWNYSSKNESFTPVE